MTEDIQFEWHNDRVDVFHAAVQGAANFTPAMLPELWSGNLCPYSGSIYREAWYRGFYSAACWYLIDRIALMGRTWESYLGKMFEFYSQEHTNNEWKRVPGGVPYCSGPEAAGVSDENPTK